MFNITTFRVHQIDSTNIYLGTKELVQAYDQTEKVMAIINNYVTRQSALPFLTSIPEKLPRAVIQASGSIQVVHPFYKSVPED